MKPLLSHLGLGTAQFGAVYGINNKGRMVSDADMNRILCMARDKGIKTIDTAVAYGQAEQRLGQHDLSSFDVVTKIMAPETLEAATQFNPENMINTSLDRLGLSQLDAVLVHNAEQIPLDILSRVISKLDLLVEKGLCRKTGVSLYDPAKLSALFPEYVPRLVQVPFNVFDQRLTDGNLQQLCQMKDVEIHVRSIFLQGLLLMEKKSVPDYFQPWAGQFAGWRDHLASHGLSSVEGIMGFVNMHKDKTVSRFIIGAETPEQFEMMIAAAETPALAYSGYMRCDDLGLIDPTRWKLS